MQYELSCTSPEGAKCPSAALPLLTCRATAHIHPLRKWSCIPACISVAPDRHPDHVRTVSSLTQALEGGDAASAGMGPTFDREAGHLSGHHGAFVAHWLRLLALEETGLAEKRSEIWRLHGEASGLAEPAPCAVACVGRSPRSNLLPCALQLLGAP